MVRRKSLGYSLVIHVVALLEVLPGTTGITFGQSDSDSTIAQDLRNAEELVKRSNRAEQSQGFQLCKKHAQNGVPEAMGLLGSIYLNAPASDNNEANALYWFRKGAELDDARAINGLGVCYFYGRGVERI